MERRKEKKRVERSEGTSPPPPASTEPRVRWVQEEGLEEEDED